MNKIFLCSFASPDLSRSKSRFIKQANQMKIYKNIKIFEFKDLENFKKEQIKNFLKEGKKRLYGYASWKPHIIKSYLDDIPKNSIVQYSDIGCHFNANGISRLIEYIKICKKKNILTFQYKKPKFKAFSKFNYQEYFEYEYTKSDLWRYLNIKNGSKFLKNQQILSGIIFFKNNQFTRNLLEKWCECSNINHLIDDSQSKFKNHPNFKEHRHDQSIFSLLCKKKGVFSLSASECEWAVFNNKRTWKHLLRFPIHAKRDKKYNLVKRFIIRQIKNIKRKVKNAKN